MEEKYDALPTKAGNDSSCWPKRRSRSDLVWPCSDFRSLPSSQHLITPTSDLAYPVKNMNMSISKAVKYEV